MLHRATFQIFSTDSNTMVKIFRHLPKSEAAVHSCLQPFAEKLLFTSIFFTKVAGLQPKKKLLQRCFPVSFPNISEHFFSETLGWWLFLLNIIHFLCCVDLISKILLSNLPMFWLSLNAFFLLWLVFFIFLFFYFFITSCFFSFFLSFFFFSFENRRSGLSVSKAH